MEELDHYSLKKILSLIHSCTGISMGENKKTMIQGRLRPRMRDLGFSSFGQYLDYIKSNQEEIQGFIDLLTTNETYFFRTPRVWDFFCKEYLPQWVDKNPGKIMKVWSGASSSGEEAHTIAICCEEQKQKSATFNYQINATDISSEVLGIGAQGYYSGRSISMFMQTRKNLFDKYMIQSNEGYLVRSDLRSRIQFSSHNLFLAHPERHLYDIIFLRNVLIYFHPKDQEKVLRNVSRNLKDGGVLIIGESESLSNLEVPFCYQSPLIYRKKG